MNNLLAREYRDIGCLSEMPDEIAIGGRPIDIPSVAAPPRSCISQPNEGKEIGIINAVGEGGNAYTEYRENKNIQQQQKCQMDEWTNPTIGEWSHEKETGR